MIDTYATNSHELSYKESYLIITLPLAVVFFLIPFEIYHPQKILWENTLRLPLFFVAVGVVLFILGLPLYLLLKRLNINLASNLVLLSFYLGLHILLADLLAPLKSTPMDGFALKSLEPINYSYREGFIFLCLLAGYFLISKKKQHILASFVASIIWLVSVAYLVLILAASTGSKEKKITSLPKQDLPNIYHIVLDELQTDAAIGVLKDQKLIENLDGFTFFPYNRSNYLFTNSSFPSYMSGTTFQRNEKFKDWQKSYLAQGILPYLKHKGYHISLHIPDKNWELPEEFDHTTLHQVMRQHIDTPLPGLSDFLPIWLARLSPNFLSNEALKLGGFFESKIVKFVGYTGRYPRSIEDGIEPFASVMMLQEAIEQEKNLSSTGRYTYLHAVLPHGPYVIDGNCVYTRAMSSKKVLSYYKQAVCALHLVSQYLEELKRLNRYNSSIIIVHADTGHALHGLINIDGNTISTSRSSTPLFLPETNSLEYPKWSTDQLLARTLSFLMIKPIESKNSFTISEHYSTLLDVYPTVLFLVDGSADKNLTGSSLFGTISTSKENNKYYLYDPRLATPNIIALDWDASKATAHLNKLNANQF
jgi:hypothetical protein